MRFRHHCEEPSRRDVRTEAFRANDLNRVLLTELSSVLKDVGFKRLGSSGWIRSEGDVHHIIAVQCRQSGWDSHSGNRFIVEYEQSSRPTRATGFSRQRIWGLLDDSSRRKALDFNSRVAQTLPSPDQQFVRELSSDVREHYLRQFQPTTQTIDSSDVWFAYYDETDAAVWAKFLARNVQSSLDTFLSRSSEAGERPVWVR